MKTDQDQDEAFIRWQATHSSMKCPMCSAAQWAVGREYVVCIKYSEGGKELKSRPLAQITCENCFFVAFFSAESILAGGSHNSITSGD